MEDPYTQIWTDLDIILEKREQNSEVKRHTVINIQKLLERWMKYRREINGFTDIISTHVCEFNLCVKTKRIQLINLAESLYGCIYSGIYHICKENRSSCNNLTNNEDGIIICTFSGVEIEKKIEENRYGRPKKDYHIFDEGSSPSKAEIEIENQMRESMEKESIMSDINQENIPKPSSLINSKLNKTSLFIEEEFKEIESSPALSRRNNSNNKTQRQCFFDSNLQNIRRDISSVIYDLLYNENERKRIDNYNVKQMKEHAKNSIRKYYKRHKQSRSHPFRNDLENLYDCSLTKKMRLQPLKYDRRRLDYYVQLICNLWRLIIKTPYFLENHSKFHLKQHTIGIMYMLQMPFIVADENEKNCTIIPQDEFLNTHLPHQNDLKIWHSCNPKKWIFNKKDVTTGRNNFKNSFNSIVTKEEKLRFLNEIKNQVNYTL